MKWLKKELNILNLKKIKKTLIKKYKYLNCFRFKGKKILILSDSHGGVFEYIHDNNLLNPHIINAEIIGGATAYGLAKEHSKTNSFNKYKNGLQRFKSYNTILIQLGEVDASFILWKKMQSENLSIEQTIQLSIFGYEKLIKHLKSLNNKTIIITGAILPTLKDSQKAGESAVLRNTINISQLKRTNLILKYNEALQKLSNQYNLSYIDITNETINKNTGMIKDYYLHDSKIDHHQSFKKTSLLWVKKMELIIWRIY